MTEPYGRLSVGGDHDRLVSTSQLASNVVTPRHDASALVWGADMLGLARAVTKTLDSPSLVAVADGSESRSRSSEPVRFPDPVGVREATSVAASINPVRELAAPGRDQWSAIRVVGERTLALVDDGRFAAAAILAAAALLPAGPVWDHHEAFLKETRRLGLTFAQAVG